VRISDKPDDIRLCTNDKLRNTSGVIHFKRGQNVRVAQLGNNVVLQVTTHLF